MEKTSRAAGLILVLALVSLEALACKHSGPAPAKLRLAFGSRSAATKSLAPEEIAISTIRISGSGPAGATTSAESTDCLPVELELVPGAWTILAKGYSSKKIEVASGFIQIELSSSQSLNKEILLSPTVGDGSLSIAWKLVGEADGALRVVGSLEGSGGDMKAIDSAFSDGGLRFDSLRSGSWILRLKLVDEGAELCGLAEGVLVAAGMETKASLSFKPPDATLALAFVVPDYSSLCFAVEPSSRRASRGTRLVYRAAATAPLAWYLDGSLVPASEAELAIDTGQGGLVGAASAGFRLDCLQTSGLLPRSGSASAIIGTEQSLGRLRWGELLDINVGSEAGKAAMRALDDCKDLAWSSDGSILAAAGKGSDAISLFSSPRPGTIVALSSLGGSALPALDAPSLLRFLPCGAILSLSETPGAAYAIQRDSSGLSLAAVLADPCLAAAKDMVVLWEGSAAYVAASGANAVSIITLDGQGRPSSARAVAAKSSGGDLAKLSAPSCLALSPDASILAVGTKTDDSVFFFDRGADNALAFRSRIVQASSGSLAALSDPCSLAFSPDGGSLFALADGGYAVFRFDKDPGSGAYALGASARSGSGGVFGYASPKRLALSPDGRVLAIVGSGSSDGLALFDTGARGALAFIGCLLPHEGQAVPSKPCALAFSPDGSVLALANDGKLSIFSVSP